MMNGWMAAGMGLWGVVLVVVVIAAVAGAVLGGLWWARRLRAGHADTAPADEARERLRRRYAAGEIDDEEFERRLAALTWR